MTDFKSKYEIRADIVGKIHTIIEADNIKDAISYLKTQIRYNLKNINIKKVNSSRNAQRTSSAHINATNKQKAL